MSSWLDGIEGEDAQELVESDSSVIRVVAGPGSGKTTCLKGRIQRLIEKDKIDPKKIFVGTFTRTIARELEKNLDPRVKVSTIHSLAYKLLLENPAACQGMKLRFLLQYEEDALLYDVKDSALNIGTISDARKELLLLQSNRSQRIQYTNARFDGAIRRWLQRHQAMLIGEVVYLCISGLENEDIPSRSFDYVMIDEYQDLTAAEQELVNLIWSKTGALTVMGDNDQSIYRFRFNHPQGIADFDKTWPQCKDLTFIDNRRCGKRILDIANLMMANAGSTKPPMIAKNVSTGNLRAVHWETLDDEIKGLADYIRSHVDKSFLVLVPRRFIGRRLVDAIGSEAKTMFHEETLEHSIARESFITASLLADPEDFVAVRTYLGLHGTKQEHAPNYNAKAYATLPTGIGGHKIIHSIANDEITVSGAGKEHIKKRAKKAFELINRSLTAGQIIDLAFDERLAEGENDDEKRGWLIENLQELRAASHELLSEQDSPDLPKVIAILRYRIATRAPLQTSNSQEPLVKIMTLHSAKGLQSENVVIAGVADQFMPGKETDIQDIEEKRRLLYVAITRARDNLIISWPRKIRIADMMSNKGQSDVIRSFNGSRYAVTSRSRLLPPALSSIHGEQLLAATNLSK